MITNRMPFEYKYQSNRLLEQLRRHDQGSRRPLKFEAALTLGPVSLQMSRPESDHTNMHELAAQAVKLVSGHTSQLRDALIENYVMDQLELSYGIFEPLMGWSGGKVACYRGELATVDGGRIFLAMFGSASNVIGYRSEGGTGYYPSDVMGLYTLLGLAREPGDAEIDQEFLWDDGRLGRQTRAEAAIGFADHGASIPIGAHTFLARVFDWHDDFRFEDGGSGRVLIGTPLWIATPQPTPDPVARSRGILG